MASLIQGFEYDIFISYRQKDNKHDGWVTGFVDNLKAELESIFKEDISIYFDENPQDRLQETHNVDKSLEGKLKCLIFIPVLSQTYCDPNSYAWQNEFLAFIKMAENDQFGKDVKLRSGNVASRILPIRIHDLEPEDVKLFEKETRSILRALDFIFKTSTGVNRPLRINEDHPNDNLNKTFFSDQINKVANAIKEIILALKAEAGLSLKEAPQRNEPSEKVGIEETGKEKEKPAKFNKLKLLSAIAILIILIISAVFAYPKIFRQDKQGNLKSSETIEKSIAVLPFTLLSNEPDKQYLADGVMDAILLHLQKFKDLRVLSRTSVEQYRGTKKTTHAIGQELGVSYLLEGSFQKSGDNVRLIVQLIKASSKENHAWANEYDRNWKDIFSVQSEVAQTIAGELHTVITPSEKNLVEKVPTTNLTAYDFYLRGEEEFSKYSINNTDRKALGKAEDFYHEALKHDSTFARAYVGLATVYKLRKYKVSYLSESFLDSVLILVNKALSFDSQLSEAYTIKGDYYVEKGLSEKANEEFDKALKYNPNDCQAYYNKGRLYNVDLPDLVKAIDNMHKAVARNRGADLSSYLGFLAWNYLCAGLGDKAKYYYQEIYKLDRDSAIYLSNLSWIKWNNENFEDALKLAKKSNENDSTKIISMMYYYFLPSNYNEEAYICAKKWIEYYKKTGTLYIGWYYRYAIAFRRMGKYKEADYYFNQQIKYCEESIKLGREWAEYGGSYYDLAAIYAFLGDKVKAYKYLDEFDKIKFYPLWWMVLIRHDQFFDNIRGEEHFQKIQKNAETKYQAEHERVRKWLEENKML
jgi:TolB-like protein/Tfp pilus assembly protein PilF